jgi:AbrB family looped-hinge helix DNA binding protein
MAQVTVSSKGQVVIPRDTRRRLGIRAGTRLDIVTEPTGFRALVSARGKSRQAGDVRGCAAYRGKPLAVKEMNPLDALRQPRARA